jgi:hypothetical protein
MSNPLLIGIKACQKENEKTKVKELITGFIGG